VISDDRLGKLVRDGDRIGLRFERELAHSPERVWQAITESDQLRHWMPCTIDGPREAGAEVSVPFAPDVVTKYEIAEPVMSGRIVTWDPPRAFSWMWDTDTLIFELTSVPSGTRLVLTTWITQGPSLDQIAAGYHVCLDQLERLVDTDSPPPFIDQEPDPAAYADLAEITFPQ
jgi:uncharacterized protein YndB with AHSA1/START domain